MNKYAILVAMFVPISILCWQPAAGEPCASPDNVTSVSGTAHCLQIKTYTPPDGSAGTLAVVLHGALSRGGDADYIIGTARISATYGAVGVAMARPGYTLDGRTSTGVATRDKHPWYWHRSDEIDSIAATVAALKKHHGSERVVMVGHSAGAVVSGVILGRRAPLVDAVVLVSCPCDFQEYRSHHDREPLPRAESPVDYLDAVPRSARIFAVTGKRDRVTPPFLARDYVERARKHGLDATFLLVEQAGHGFARLDESAELDEALWNAIKSR